MFFGLQFYVGLGYITGEDMVRYFHGSPRPKTYMPLLPSGGSGGVTAGLYRFASFKPEALGPDTMKLKANRLLNSVGKQYEINSKEIN